MKGISQEYMAQMLKISQNQYSKIETGKIQLTISRLEKICEILEIDIKKMIELDDQNIYNHFNENNGNVANNDIHLYNDKIEEVYKELINQKESENKNIKQHSDKMENIFKEQIKQLKSEIDYLRD